MTEPRLLHMEFYSENVGLPSEGVIIDTSGASDAKLEGWHGGKIVGRIALTGARVTSWPTDRLLVEH